MRLSRFAIPMLLCGTATTAQTPPVISVSPLGASFSPAQQFVTWTAQDVRCAGVPIAFTQAPPVIPSLEWWNPQFGTKPVGFTFTIDGEGRPLDVARTDKAFVPAGSDLMPALVVGRFAPGAPRQACTLNFVPSVQPVADAPIPSVLAYIMFPQQRPSAAMYARVRPAGSTCFAPPPQIRTRAYPDFDAIPKQPGRQGWSMTGFDIDASGKPIHLRHEAGSGNAALDAASLKAVRDSRFAPGARTGCQYPYWIAPATMPPPPIPEEATFRPADATCPTKADWAVKPPLIYPPSFGRRWIEGWAVIGYDVAPWGATGNVRVLAAQPAAEFGEQAMRMLQSAKRTASATGYVGCVNRVSFRMPRKGGEARSEAPPPPPPPSF